MRRVDREHIERRVTCTGCPTKYCIDCNSTGCPNCGIDSFYTTHTATADYPKTDIMHVNDIDYQPINTQRISPPLRFNEGDTLTNVEGVIRRGDPITINTNGANGFIGTAASIGNGLIDRLSDERRTLEDEAEMLRSRELQRFQHNEARLEQVERIVNRPMVDEVQDNFWENALASNSSTTYATANTAQDMPLPASINRNLPGEIILSYIPQF